MKLKVRIFSKKTHLILLASVRKKYSFDIHDSPMGVADTIANVKLLLKNNLDAYNKYTMHINISININGNHF